MAEVVPFLLEDKLTALGADFTKVGDFQPYAVRDGLLITGQNPASSQPAARILLQALQETKQEIVTEIPA